MIKYILILFLFVTPVSAYKIGVSPSQIEMNGTSEFYVINSNNFKTKFKLISEVVNFDKESFYLDALEKTKITIRQKSKENGFIEVLSGENLVSSLQIPVKFEETIKKKITKENRFSNKKEIRGILLITLFNLIGLVIGGLVWKKKIFWSSQ